MADIYVRSTDGSNANSGATWALAKLDGAGADAIDVAGDRILFSQVHNESTAAAISWAIAGTAAIPSRLLCVNDGAQPPIALATSGVVTTTGASAITLGGSFYCYGLTFNAGTGAVTANIAQTQAADFAQFYENCVFSLLSNGSASRISLGRGSTTAASSLITWKNCNIKFSNTSQGILLNGVNFHWNGGSILSGSAVTSLFRNPTNGALMLVENVDFSSGLAANFTLTLIGTAQKLTFRNCKFPVNWSGSPVGGTLAPSSRVEMFNCDGADTNYRLQISDYAGTITQETTLVKTGGASDGTTPISWKLAATANASYPTVPLVSPEIARWNATTGMPVTVTVDVLSDSVTNLTDSEIWLDVQYQGTAGFPLGVDVNDATATVLTAAADQTASTAVWTTTGMANPNRQKLSVTFTPQHAGFIQATANFTKASATVYVDPVLQVS